MDALLDDLRANIDGGEVASRVYLSRFHFDRLVRAAVGEPPARLRRRILLEQAAYALGRGATVTDVAVASGYGSPEAFGRAFSRAHGSPPSDFINRKRPFLLPAPNGIHFHPPCGLVLPGLEEDKSTMDLTELMTEHDLWVTDQMLRLAAEVADEILDRPIVLSMENLDDDPVTGTRPSIRCLLNALVRNKEMWGANFTGADYVDRQDDSVGGMRRRFDAAVPVYRAAITRIVANNEWNTAFVDAVCEPPQTFTYGGAVAHVLTFSAYRRTEALLAFHAAGYRNLGIGDPMHFDRRSLGGHILVTEPSPRGTGEDHNVGGSGEHAGAQRRRLDRSP
jgi:AraC family transcriptional regulator